MNRVLSVILISTFFYACQPNENVPIQLEIQDNWQFKNTVDSVWFNAEVPGEIHSDLLRNQLIDDPFVGNNELKLQWISDNDWEYKTEFSLSNEVLDKNHIELTFEGLDTYAQVTLNDSIILNTNNAFRTWQVNVKHLLKNTNTLHIVFEKTIETEEEEKAKLLYNLPEGYRIFTRKAQFQYGWDWGPKFNTSGIWRPVTLTAWDEGQIEDVYIKQEQISESAADVTAAVIVNSSVEGKFSMDILVNSNLIKTSNFKVQKGSSVLELSFTINKPQLWWPHNLGEPYLYDIELVLKKGRTVLDTFQLKKGLRTIELVTEKDSIGESFYFKINDVPVYMKGANYIPQNSFQNQVTNNHYQNLLNDVVNANMNMLRVWGGGIYENDIFYDLCDEKGILVWQDFMFACAMYPGDNDFLRNIEQEAVDNVNRLRNHASLALWCGNNENSEGWHRWGWQEGRSEEEKTEIWNNYLKVFDSILPKVVEQLSPEIDYWESSPKYGRGNPKYKTEGDAHDWWIWHDAYPFEHLETEVPRFMSEFGMQSFPGYETIRYINQSDSISISSKLYETHQKHARGFELIREYMERDFPVPQNDADYVYMSQLVQAYGITKGILAQRRNRPYNMGTLYWQLNDCWPVTSWSSIDFFGNWKALHYKAKQAFKNTIISHDIFDAKLRTYVVNDQLEDISGDLEIRVLNYNGDILKEVITSAEIKAGSSKMIHILELNEFLDKLDAIVVVAKYLDAMSFYYLVEPKSLKLQQAEIDVEITKVEDGFKVKLKSSTLQKDVFLFTDKKGHFSHNFFDLMPNELKEVHFKTSSESLDDLKIKSLNSFIR